MPRGSAPVPSKLGQEISQAIDAACGPRGRKGTARKVGISQSRFDLLVKGERTWYLGELEAVCEALGLDIVQVVADARRRTEVVQLDHRRRVTPRNDDLLAVAEDRDGTDEGDYEGA